MKDQRNKIIKGILFLFLFINILRYYIENNTDMSYSSISLSILMAFFAIILYVVRIEKIAMVRNNSIDAIFIICLSIFIVHFFEYIALMVGALDSISYFEFFNKKLVNTSVIASSSALISFIIGALLVKDSIGEIRYNFYYVRIDKQLEIVQFLCLILFVAVTEKQYFQGGYNSIDELSTPSYVSQQILQACLYANIANKFLNFHNKKSVREYFKGFSPLFYTTNIIYLFLVILSGDRGPIIYITIPFVFSIFIQCKKRLTLRQFAIIGVTGIILLNFLGAVRSLGEGAMTSQRLEEGLGRTQERLEGGVFFGAFRELSGSIKAYNVLYKATEDYGPIYGLGIIDQTIGIMPGLRFIIYPQLGIDTKEYGTAYVSTLLLGEDHGMGTTCIGDVYFNVGFWGTILVFLFFGYVIRLLFLRLYNPNTHYFFIILGIGYISYAIYIGRGSFFSPFNVCGYSWMLYFLLSMINKKKKANSERKC